MKLSQLQAAVVHDLKNQLQSLLDFEQQALSRIPPEYHQELTPILQRTNRLKNDSLQLIALYRFQESQLPENRLQEAAHFPLDDAWPRDTISDAIEATSLQFPSITFHNNSDIDCQGFYNETLLQLALVTLITNSAQAGAKAIWFDATETNTGLEISVRDNGPGFASEVLDGEISSTKSDMGGLGLFFVELICQYHQQGENKGRLQLANYASLDHPLDGAGNPPVDGAEVRLHLP